MNEFHLFLHIVVCASVIHSFFLAMYYSIYCMTTYPLCRWLTFAVSITGQLLRVLLWAFFHAHACEFSQLVPIGVQLLGWTECVSSTFPNSSNLFSKVILWFYTWTSSAWEFPLLSILTNTCVIRLFNICTSVSSLVHYQIMVLTSISLLANQIEYLFICL